ncbi:MAG: amino acid-binding protein [Deltaproteobacteria bacterium]|nr:MAG: amino acid-binding protein [Deltaproteobacteria bacterium]RLB86993.1 MAG: amino acid-binding protein [Deltaproteobacteria bacterium]
MKLKQISVFIENSPARLYNVASALAEAGINLRALNLVDKGDFGVLRLLVSDITKARQIIMQMHLPARVDEVIAAEIDDRPGELARLLKPLLDGGVVVEYMYAFLGFSPGKAVMIFRFSDNDQAIEALRKINVRLLDAESFGMLDSTT